MYQDYCQLTLDGHLEEYCETWPRSGCLSNGTAFQLAPLAPLTDATVSGLLPTPTDPRHGVDLGQPNGDNLATAVQMWRTPQARDGDPRGQQPPEKRVAGGHSVSLAEQVMWPTPQAHDFKSGTGYSHENKSQTPQLRHIMGGTLNPEWVSLLMGYPKNWTEV